LRSLSGHTGLITCVKFNEVHVASGSRDTKAKIWDTQTGIATQTLDHNGAVNCLLLNEGKYEVVTGSNDNSVKIWDIRSGNRNHNLTTPSGVQGVQADDRYLASFESGCVRVWDLRNDFASVWHAANNVTCFSLVGSKLITGGSNGNLTIYDSTNGTQLLHTNAHPSAINCIECDGNNIVTGSQDSTLQIWNLNTRVRTFTLSEHSAPVHTVQFDGKKVVSGSADNSIKVWDCSNGKRIYTLLGGSLQIRGKNTPHPTKPGCSYLRYDESKIVASFNSLFRVYNFQGKS